MYLAVLCLLSTVLAQLPASSLGCSGPVRLYQVAAEQSWVRVRMQLPPACNLHLMGTSAGPVLTIRQANLTASASSVLGQRVVNSLRQFPGSDRLDLLHTFNKLRPSGNYSVCLSRHTLVALNGTKYPRVQLCCLALTNSSPGPTRWDSILGVCLAILYILALLVLAVICWRLRTCLGSWSGQMVCDPEAAEFAETKMAEAAAAQPVVPIKITRSTMV